MWGEELVREFETDNYKLERCAKGRDQNHPKKEKCKKAKWLSAEALQIAVKRREVKGKGEKERYTHLNAGFQRRAKKDKKAFLSDQCKEIEENNRFGKTRDVFKKSKRSQGNTSCNMDTIEDGNSMNLREGEDIKKMW